MTRFPFRIAPDAVLWLANLAGVVVAIAVIAWVVERLLRNRSLPARHGVLLAAILLTAMSPLLLAAATGLGWGFQVPLAWDEVLPEAAAPTPSKPPVVHEQPAAPRDEIDSPAVANAPVRPLTVGDFLEPGEVLQFRSQETSPAPIDHQAAEPIAATPIVSHEPTSRIRRIDWRPWISTVGGLCILIWSAGTILAGLRLIIGWRQVHGLKQSLQLVDHPTLRVKLTQSAEAAGLRSVPRLMSSLSVPVPAVCGLWRPIIILPEQFVEEPNNPSLDSILLHECAHIRRRDLWVGWLQRIVGAAFWWNVPLYSVQRRLNDLREDLCDNHVLAQHPDGRGYARVLLDLVSRASGSRPIPVSVGLVEGPSSGLSARITRLLREDRNMATNLNRGPAAALIALAGLMAVAICGLSLRAEQAVADDGSTGTIQTTNPDTPLAVDGDAADEATAEEPPADQPPAVPQLIEQTQILSPLFYDDQMLALVNAYGAAAVRFERQDNGIVRYEWRYLSAADATLDPKATLDPNPHELRGEGTLEPIMAGPMPHIAAGPIHLSWSPSTELQGWVSFNPAMLEVLPFKRSLFAVEKGPFDSIAEALDLSSLLVSDDVPGDRTVEQLPPPIRHVASRLVYDAMVLVVSHPDGVAAFEFYDSFSEGNMQTQSRDGVRYRCYYRHDNGIDDAIGFGEVYEVYKDGQYNQGLLELEAGPMRIEWSNGDADVGWIYYDPRDVHCSLVSREYFEQFLPAGSSETDRRFDLGRFRYGLRPLTPPVDPSIVADTDPQFTVADDADPDQIRRQRVADAIEKGLAFLVSQQNETGQWSHQPGPHEMGVHSLALLGLLECGKPIDDPAVAVGLQWLRDQDDPDQTYSIALMMMALAAAGEEDDRERITRLAESLQAIQGDAGAWGYNGTSGNWWDNSNSQYAVYGLYAAHHSEVDVGLEVVRAAIDHYVDAQIGDVAAEDGAGWNYRGETGGVVSGNMTASAIASLIMLSVILEDQPELSEEDTARVAASVQAIEAGQRWLERHFTVRRNPGEEVWLLCYLMNLRHAAEMSELTLIGDHNWYREGADILVAGQNVNDGSWVSASEIDPVVATSMALLFLSAGLDVAEQEVSFLPPENPPIAPGPMASTGGANPLVTQPPVSQETPAPMNPPFPTEPDPFGDPNQQSQPGYEFTRDPIASPDSSSDGPRTIVLIDLQAADDGSLGELRFFNESLGSGLEAIELLAARIEQLKSQRATARELYHLVAHVTADESLQYGAVVGVIDACQIAGIESINLSTGPTDGAIVASVGYLRDVSGRKISEDAILSLPRATGSVDEAASLFQNLTDRLGSEVHEHGGPLLPRDLIFQLNIDHEISSDVVQRIIQHAAHAGFEKFSLRSLGGDEAPTDPSMSVTSAFPPVAESNIVGEVTTVDEANKLVDLSIGFDDGVEMWQQYSIWRSKEAEPGFDFIAICEVMVVTADQSGGRVVVQMGQSFPKPGDQVVEVQIRAPGEVSESTPDAGEPQSYDHPLETSPSDLALLLEDHRQLLSQRKLVLEELLQRFGGLHPQVQTSQRIIQSLEESIKELETELPAARQRQQNYLNELRYQHVELRRQEEELLNYGLGPDHPDVTQLRERIEAVEAELLKLAPQTPPQEHEPLDDAATNGDNGTTSASESELREQIAAALGLELEPVPATDDRLAGTDFHGGLEVFGVRADSPAASEGIQMGDILVGLHQWETISLDNVAFVLTRDESRPITQIQFFVVRDGETMHGQIRPENIDPNGEIGATPNPFQNDQSLDPPR